MKAAILDQPNALRIGDASDPTPGVGEVVVKVGAVGVCGSDLNIAAGLFPPTPFPIIPGHELAGEVVAVRSGVTFISEGDRVAVDPSLFCGHCTWCRIGRGNLCDNWGAIGDTVNGGAAEYVAVPAANCYQLPDHLSYTEGAAIEPLSCAVHAIHMAPPRVGESALVVGAGTMGLLTGQLLARGGANVAVVDRKADRLPIAREVGFEQAFVDVAEAQELRPTGFDLVVDATGVPAAIEAAFNSVARGGRFLQVGVAPPAAHVPISPFKIYNQEITVLGSMAVLHSYGPALDLMASGAINIQPMLTHQLPLEEYSEALETVRRGDGLKIQLLPNS
jgi:2-desacetyl-2-hydroxyethyl bacteriochlorophyllide A dehydrogenase